MATRTPVRYGTQYISLGKGFPDVEVLPQQEATRESAYYMLSKMIDEEFIPEEAITLEKIYDHVTRELGLSKSESSYLVRECVKHGFIRKGKIRL